MHEQAKDVTSATCPIPFGASDAIQLAHGGGGRRMRSLIEKLIVPTLGGDAAAQPLHDGCYPAYLLEHPRVNEIFLGH